MPRRSLLTLFNFNNCQPISCQNNPISRFWKFSKLRTAICAPKSAPFATDIWKTRFRRFPMFHFSTSKIFFVKNFSKIFGDWPMISSFWKSWSILSVTIEFSLKNDPDLPKVQVSTFLGEGVQGRLKFFFVDFGPKRIYSFCSMGHMMIWWYEDMIRTFQRFKLWCQNLRTFQKFLI